MDKKHSKLLSLSKKKIEILENLGWPGKYIRAVLSHGWSICTDIEPTTDLEKKKRWYTLPPTVLSIERVEILDNNDRYIMIPKLSDPHKLLRADTDASNDALK